MSSTLLPEDVFCGGGGGGGWRRTVDSPDSQSATELLALDDESGRDCKLPEELAICIIKDEGVPTSLAGDEPFSCDVKL